MEAQNMIYSIYIYGTVWFLISLQYKMLQEGQMHEI